LEVKRQRRINYKLRRTDSQAKPVAEWGKDYLYCVRLLARIAGEGLKED
jgi:hypothetical protein